MAAGFLDTRRAPETLKTWVNTVLGETWEEDAERIEGHGLAGRLEDWGDAAPAGVLVITCGVTEAKAEEWPGWHLRPQGGPHSGVLVTAMERRRS